MSVDLLTIGYGSTTKEDFQKRISELKEKHHVYCVVDIRKENSKSRNGRWCWWGVRHEESMYGTLYEIGVEYETWPAMCNPFGNSVEGFRKYANRLERDREIQESLLNLTDLIYDSLLNGLVVCLLCAERKPFKKSGRANCHRVLLIKEINLSLFITSPLY